ncbi:MAG: hypothetical protein AAGD86_14830, partial [Pseudomonadota bacterium]
GGGAFLPIMSELARSGIHVIFVNTRYRGNDSALIMEKCLRDLGAGISDARQRFGYVRIVLGGWSGGGSLSLFYQDAAENRHIHDTPAGDPVDLAEATLVPADGVALIAAHVSRNVTLTEWMDASIVDELDPTAKHAELDLYDPANPNQPPYTDDFLSAYRAAQIARNRRITDWVSETLSALRASDGPGAERAFVLAPLQELAADVVVPGLETRVDALWQALDHHGEIIAREGFFGA